MSKLHIHEIPLKPVPSLVAPFPLKPDFLIGFTIGNAVSVTERGRRFSLVFKRALWRAYEGRCAYCNEDIPTHKAMNVDHFEALCRGGGDSIENFVCACKSCNSAKSGNDGIEILRASIRLRNSKFRNIIGPTQLIALEASGAMIPVPAWVFPFEMEAGQ